MDLRGFWELFAFAQSPIQLRCIGICGNRTAYNVINQAGDVIGIMVKEG
jgi:hypothetical protein